MKRTRIGTGTGKRGVGGRRRAAGEGVMGGIR